MIPKPLARVRSRTAGRSRSRDGEAGLARELTEAGRRSGGDRGGGWMTRRGDTHRVMRWLWTSRRPDARLARLALLPASGLWRGAMAVREAGVSPRLVRVHDLPLPVRRRRQSHRRRLRQDSHRHLDRAPLRVSRPGPGHPAPRLWRRRDAGASARRARGRSWPIPIAPRAPSERWPTGREVLVLDDAYQRLDVRRDLNIAVVSAETTRAVRWSLPAGPWREGLARAGPGRRRHRHPQARDG